MRLIDADSAKIEFCRNCLEKEKCEERETICSDYANFAATLESMPTIAAETVKHGTWRKGENFGGEFCDCSVCNVRHYNVSFWKYCPNCGAKMDGGMKK